MTGKAGDTVLKRGSQPVSRVLSRTIIHLGCMSPYTSCGLPGDNAGHIITPLFGLAPGGVCNAVPVASHAVRSYRTISPLPGRNCRPGGIFSVALSVGSRRPGITWRPAHAEPGLSSAKTGLVEPGGHDSDCPADSRLHISPESDCTPPSLSPHLPTVIPAPGCLAAWVSCNFFISYCGFVRLAV